VYVEKRIGFNVITNAAFPEYDKDKRTKLFSPVRENALVIYVMVEETRLGVGDSKHNLQKLVLP
jgi:phage terminase large subunit-like protein